LAVPESLAQMQTVVGTVVVAPAAITTAKVLAEECQTFARVQRFLQLLVAAAVKVAGPVVPVVPVVDS
jgi:hypothetical protein